MRPDLLAAYDPGPGRLVRADMVVSVDGAAVVAGSSRALSTPADRVVFRTLRALSDVVLVGAGTARAEAYGAARRPGDPPVPLSREHRDWRERRGRPPTPALAVVSRSLDLPRELVERAVVVTCASAPHEGLPDVVVAGARTVDLAVALDRLADRGLPHVLCEGGPGLLADLVGAALLDELCLTVSPHLVGPAPGLLSAGLPGPLPLRLLGVRDEDGTLLTRWRLPGPAEEPGAGRRGAGRRGSRGAGGGSTTGA